MFSYFHSRIHTQTVGANPPSADSFVNPDIVLHLLTPFNAMVATVVIENKVSLQDLCTDVVCALGEGRVETTVGGAGGEGSHSS